MLTIRDKAAAAKEASRRLATLDGNLKNRAIEVIAQTLEQRMGEIVAANREDCERSEREGVVAPVLKRLAFGEAKIRDVIDALRSLQRLQEPGGSHHPGHRTLTTPAWLQGDIGPCRP